LALCVTGSGANKWCGQYLPMMNHLASHSFIVIASLMTSQLGARGFLISGPRPDVHSSLRPAPLLTPPCGALSVGFSAKISLLGATQAMWLRSSAASELSPYGFMGDLQASLVAISAIFPLHNGYPPAAAKDLDSSMAPACALPAGLEVYRPVTVAPQSGAT
jgi:hypothetical protein